MNIYESVINYKVNNPGTLAFRIKEHASVVEKNIKPGEKVLYAFCGQGVGVNSGFESDSRFSSYGTCVVAFTDKRIIIGHKGLLFGHKLKSIDLKRFNDATIEKGLFWSSLNIDTIKEEFKVSCLTENGANEAEEALTKALNNTYVEEKKPEVKRESVKQKTVSRQNTVKRSNTDDIKYEMNRRAKLDTSLRKKLDMTTNPEERKAIRKQIIDNYNQYIYLKSLSDEQYICATEKRLVRKIRF